MTEKRFVWFRSLRFPGEEALDLYQCRRFFISQYDAHSLTEYTLVYYKFENRWIECRGDEEFDDSFGDMRVYYVEGYRECNPITVAHELTAHNTFQGELPEELEEYRSYGDADKYAEWLSQTGAGKGRRVIEQEWQRPRWDGSTVYLGTKVCKEFTRLAREQTKLLDAFEAKNWPRQVSNPFSCQDQLKNTIVTMNKWPGSPILFRRDGRRASWWLRGQRSNSSNSP